LQVHAANLSGAVVEIEVATQVVVLGFLHECWSSRSSSVSITVSAAHPVVCSAGCTCLTPEVA